MTDARGLIDAWVEESAPADVDAAWASVEARAAGGEVPALEGSAGVPVAKLAVLAVVVGAVAVLALAGPRGEDGGGAAVVGAAQHEPEEVEPEPEAVEAQEPLAEPDPDPDPVESGVAEEAEQEEAVPAAKKRPKAVRDQRPSLAAELELLRKARGALRGKNARRALALARRHRKEYPKSAFAEERNATEVMALCALGRTNVARDTAAAFRRRYPRSTFNAGLMDACEGTEP